MSDLELVSYESLREINENQWDHVVEHSAQGCVFHRYGWLKTVEDALGYEPRHLVVYKKANPIAVFPNFITGIDLPAPSTLAEKMPLLHLLSKTAEVSSVFNEPPLKQMVSVKPGFGGPVITSNEQDCLELLFEAVEQMGQPNVLLHSIRAKETGYLRYGKFFTKRGYTPSLVDCRFELDLNLEWKELESKMHKERRRAIRKAHESDVTVREVDTTREDVQRTYETYQRNMDRIDGNVLPASFFQGLRENMPDRMMIFAAERDGVDLGRYVYVLDNEQETLHYFFSAIGDESSFEYYPSELLHEHGIKWAKEHGYRSYDFGSTGSTFTDSLFKYKEKYGGQPVPTFQWEKNSSRILGGAYTVARNVFQRQTY